MPAQNLLNTPPITPICGHVARAQDFYNRGIKYFAIGKSTPWANTNGVGDEVPDLPDPNATRLLEVIGYKKVELQVFVVPDSINGQYLFKNQRWRVVAPEAAQASQARWIWLESVLLPEDFNMEDYREIGVFSGLQTVAEVPPQHSTLSPEQVVNPGILEFLDNRRPIHRMQTQDEQFVIILEF